VARSAVAILACAAALPAAAWANDSVYTDLDLDKCEMLELIEEGESVRWRCPGHATIALLVSSGDGRFDIDAGIANDEWETLGQFNNPGPRVEWRMDGRVPIAIIFRLVSADPERPGGALFVETIGRAEAPGCTVAVIDSAVRDANAVAREMADRRAPRFRCGVDSVARPPPR
jgi:hypothetical protein